MSFDVEPGQVSDGHEERQRFFKATQHQLIRVIGGGAYGKVWLARSVTGTYRAVKIVFRRDFKSDTPYEREYKGILKFEPISRDHDGFIDILHVGRDDEAGYYYYIMELGDDVETGSRIVPETYQPDTLDLQRRLHRRIPFEKALQFSLKLTLALSAVHKSGLVHRDIKPQNIVLVSGSPKLADIGLVTDAGLDVSFVGTEGYIPGEGPGKPSADIYSLGKSLYEITTGNDRMEFPELPGELLEDPVDGARFAEFNEILIKACEREPAARYQSAEEMHVHLALLQAGKSVRRILELERWRLRLKRYGIAALAIATAFAAIFFMVVRDQQRAVKERRDRTANVLGYANNLVQAGDYLAALPWLVDALEADKGDAARERNHRLRLGSVLDSSPRVVQVWYHPVAHGLHAAGVQFTPDGQKVLIADTNGQWALYDVATGERRTQPFGKVIHLTSAGITTAALSADGRFALAKTSGATCELVDLEKQSRVFTSGPPADLRFADFSPRGDCLAIAPGKPLADSLAAIILDPRTGQEIRQLVGHRRQIWALRFNADGSRLVTASSEGVGLWDMADGKLLGVFTNNEKRVYAVAISPDGKRIVSGSLDFSARVFDTTTMQELFPKIMHKDGVTCVDFSPDGRWFITCCWDRTVRIWNAQTGAPVHPPLRHNHKVSHARFSPDGHRIVSSSFDGTYTVWDLHGMLGEPPVTSTRFSEDGRRTATTTNGVLAVRDASTDRLIASTPWSSPNASSPVLSRSGRHILLRTAKDRTNPANASARIWNVDADAISSREWTYPRSLKTAQLSDDGRLAVMFSSTQLMVWDTSTAALKLSITEKDGFIGKAIFDHAGSRLAVVNTNIVTLWRLDVDPAEIVRSLHHSNRIGWVEFSLDDKWLATTISGSTYESCYAQIWDAKSALPVSPKLWQSDGVTAARFSPDATRLVTSSEDLSSVVWDTATWTPLHIPELTHDAQVDHAAFSDDGRWIATCGRDSTARVWDAATGLPLTLPFRHPERFISEVQFVAGNSRLVTRSISGATRVWNLPIEEKPIEDLAQISQLLSARRRSYTPFEFYLTNDVLRTSWSALRQKYPKEFR